MRFIRINEAAAEMNGLPIEALTGRRVEEVLPDIDPLLLIVPWSLCTGQPAGGDFRRVSGHPALRWREFTAAPVRDGNGNMVALAVTFNDVTQECWKTLENERHSASEVTRNSCQRGDELTKAARLRCRNRSDLLIQLFASPSSSTVAIAWQRRARSRENALIYYPGASHE
jgi:hypothetical protein